MKKILMIMALLGAWIAADALAQGQDPMYTYKGKWVTTNRRLNGIQTCNVTWLGGEKWKGRFHGTWMGIKYDYTVDFKGKPDNVTGTATIDGASYNWKGTISPEKFKATFTGSRYTGYFDMDRVDTKKK